MEQKTLTQVQDELKEVTSKRKEQESNLEQLQEKFSKIQKDLEFTLDSLKNLKDTESSLQHKLFLMQKESIKENLNIGGLKKIFSESNPLVKKIKDKGKEIKEVLDGTAFDKHWIDEKYEQYKNNCIKKGEEIKSKEEFKKIAITLKELKHDASESQIFELIGKATDSLKKVGKKVQSVLINEESNPIQEEKTTESQKVENGVVVELPKTKKEALEFWVKKFNIQYSEENIATLYEQYTIFLIQQYGQMSFAEIRYSDKGSAFKTALKKALNV